MKRCDYQVGFTDHKLHNTLTGNFLYESFQCPVIESICSTTCSPVHVYTTGTIVHVYRKFMNGTPNDIINHFNDRHLFIFHYYHNSLC